MLDDPKLDIAEIVIKKFVGNLVETYKHMYANYVPIDKVTASSPV